MIKWIVLGIVCLFLLVGGCTVLWGVGAYNSMIEQREGVNKSWSQVENVYQRRNDLIPNFVETVKGYAKHERETLTGVIQARANATKVTVDPTKLADLQKFQAVQGELSSALARLMVVVEKYPDLKANENFRDLQSELAGTENRIAVERKRFIDSAQTYNIGLKKFPRSIIAGLFGFEPRPYFEAEKGTDKAPKIQF